MKELKFKEATLLLESFFVPNKDLKNKSIFSLIASIVLRITKGELDVYSSKSEDDFFQIEHFRFVEMKQIIVFYDSFYKIYNNSTMWINRVIIIYL